MTRRPSKSDYNLYRAKTMMRKEKPKEVRDAEDLLRRIKNEINEVL